MIDLRWRTGGFFICSNFISAVGSTDGIAQPYVGVGTQIAVEGKSADLTGATAVKFKIRSHTGLATSATFKVQTLDIDKYSEVAPPVPADAFGYWAKEDIPVTTSWSEVTVAIPGDLAQPSGAKKIDFDITNVTKFAWEFTKKANLTSDVDTVDIDDVVILGNVTNIPNLCSRVNFAKFSLTTPSSCGEFATFDNNPPSKSKLGFYWYAFKDYDVEEASQIISGAVLDSELHLFNPEFFANTGSSGTDQGLRIEYKLGPALIQNGKTIQGYVGVGCNTYDSLAVKYWDSKTAYVKSIYFQYLTTSNNATVTLEVLDINDVGDADNPSRKDLRGPGVYWHRNFLSTCGNWVAVEIPFDSLVCDNNSAGKPNIPFDPSHIARIYWKVHGPKGQTGSITIDNVYFTGMRCPDAVINTLISKKNPAFNVKSSGEKLQIGFNTKREIAKGKVSIFDAQGHVINILSFDNVKNGQVSLNTKRIAYGIYFVKIDAVDLSGKKIAMQSAVNIMR